MSRRILVVGGLHSGIFFGYSAASCAVRKICLTLVNPGLTMKPSLPKLLTPLFLILAQATNKELIRQIQFLKIENEILRSRLPKTIRVTPTEKQRLLKYGRILRSAIKELITIVTPRTFARWLTEGKKGTTSLFATFFGKSLFRGGFKVTPRATMKYPKQLVLQGLCVR